MDRSLTIQFMCAICHSSGFTYADGNGALKGANLGPKQTFLTGNYWLLLLNWQGYTYEVSRPVVDSERYQSTTSYELQPQPQPQPQPQLTQPHLQHYQQQQQQPTVTVIDTAQYVTRPLSHRFHPATFLGANYKKILRLSYDVIITYVGFGWLVDEVVWACAIVVLSVDVDIWLWSELSISLYQVG